MNGNAHGDLGRERAKLLRLIDDTLKHWLPILHIGPLLEQSCKVDANHIQIEKAIGKIINNGGTTPAPPSSVQSYSYPKPPARLQFTFYTAAALAVVATLMPGPIVACTTTDFKYVPFADAGLARITASISAL
jgi:hypothetical protein